MKFQSTKIIDLGSCAFRQWKADHSHCHFIHGYKLQAKFWFTCNELDNKNWVVDFGGLKELKVALEKQFDHTLCVAADDPFLEDFKTLHNKGACDLRIMPNGVGIERTAEWCFQIADSIIRSQTNNRCWVEQVEVWEHDKNSATVRREDIITKTTDVKHVKDHKYNAEQHELNFTTPIANVVAAPSEAVTKAVQEGYKPAPVHSEVSQGLSNPFKGTTWGF